MYEGNINHGHYVGSLRLCEADIEPQFHAAAKPETPPRMRGTQIIVQFGMLDKGSIPAYAGNTCFH